MNAQIYSRNELYAQTVIKGLKSRNMDGYYAKDKEEALNLALSLIPEGSSVAMGGCTSAQEIGLLDAIKEGDYNYYDRKGPDKRAAELAAFDADVYIASCNAISQDGVLVNIDGICNRVAAIAYGPRKVVFVVGMNKIAADVDAAIKRARNIAAPVNAGRLGINTPCTKTGACMNCKSPDTICCQFMITRFSRAAGRIHVILVNEDLGY